MAIMESPAIGIRRMSHWQIALMLTLAYWAGAALWAVFEPRGGWIDLRWPLAIYFFAIPATILLWMIAIGVRVFRPALPRSRFTLIGIALPVVLLAVVVGGGSWLTEWRSEQLEDQLRAAVLSSFEDEALVGAKGPIGVKLRYKVVYPRGLDLDEDHAAFAQLFAARSRNTFVMSRRVVTPRVSGHLRAGTYEITEDFVPAFLPPSLLYPPSEPAASDHCFHWPSPSDVTRREILAEEAGPLTVAVYLAHSPIQRSTQHPYRLAAFYASAALDGALDCAR
jgi:hypothetical protein